MTTAYDEDAGRHPSQRCRNLDTRLILSAHGEQARVPFPAPAVPGLDEFYGRDDGKKWLLVPP
jgi:hypothetical protein